MEELAISLVEILREDYPNVIYERYSIEMSDDNVKVLENIAEKRKCYKKGEALDLEKAAYILIDDFRSGRLGRITLEKPLGGAGQ